MHNLEENIITQAYVLFLRTDTVIEDTNPGQEVEILETILARYLRLCVNGSVCDSFLPCSCVCMC